MNLHYPHPGDSSIQMQESSHISSNFNFFQVSCKILNKHFAYIYIYWIYHPMHIKKRTYKWYILPQLGGLDAVSTPPFLYKGTRNSQLLRVHPVEGSKAPGDDESERMAKSGQLLNVPHRRWDLEICGHFFVLISGSRGFIGPQFRRSFFWGPNFKGISKKKQVGMSLIPNFQEFRP